MYIRIILTLYIQLMGIYASVHMHPFDIHLMDIDTYIFDYFLIYFHYLHTEYIFNQDLLLYFTHFNICHVIFLLIFSQMEF